MPALTHQIWNLVCLSLLAKGENNFIFPPDGGPDGTIVGDSNLEFTIGDTIHLKWTTDSTTPITLIAFQGPRAPETFFYNLTLLNNAPAPVPTSYDWIVSPLNPADRNYLTAPIHFLLWTGFGESSFNSKYIRIKPISDRATSSATTSSSSQTSAPISTSSLSSSSSSSPTSSSSSSNPESSASSGGGEQALKIGLGVGVSLAFVLGGLLGYYLFRRASRRKSGSVGPEMVSAEDTQAVKELEANGLAVHEVHGVDAKGLGRHEAYGREIHEAP